MRYDSGVAELSKQGVQPRGGHMQRVLVVDDDPMVCMAIEIYLERHDFQVTIADGGVNGLAALDNGTFDLMIVDIFMPNMRGFESIRRFHERAPAVPLIAISGSAFPALDAPTPDFLRIAVTLGAARCLRKPFKPTTLLGVMDECFSEAEPHRKYIAALTAVVVAPPELRGGMKSLNASRRERILAV